MSAKHILMLLFFCAFALPAVSVTLCEKNMLQGVTCIIKLTNETSKTVFDIKWTFSSGGSNKFVVHRKNGKDLKTFPDAKIESDGSLKLHNVKLNNTGKYKPSAYNEIEEEIKSHEVEITVYTKALKPTVTRVCKNGNVTLTCDIQKNDKRDLTIIWLKENEDMKSDNKADLFLTSQQLQENKQYSCRIKNPVSDAQSDMITGSCGDGKLFGYDFWIMVGILSGGGALILLLMLVLVICACRSCKKREKLQDEEELRLRNFDTSPDKQQRSKATARGQPAPPVPQEHSLPATQTPPQTQSQAKGPIRARPPPPPQDEDEEEAPPLPRPRKKQHRDKRAQEPYQPME